MPGDSPALHESCRVLFHCSLPGFLVATPIFAQGLSTQVAGLQGLVPLSRSLLSLDLPCLKWLTFFVDLDLPEDLVFPLSEATAPCCLRCSVFIFHCCLLIWWSMTCSGPSALRQWNASFALLPGIFPWFCGF